MTTKRTTRERHRKALELADPVTVALFRELETTPEGRRETESYREREDDLAWRIGLHPESWLRGYRVNSAKLLDLPPKYDCFQDEWDRVTSTRARLLALAGLPADKPLFWCRRCGLFNRSDAAVRTRQCVRCHEVDATDGRVA
jgi:hypothetical protein